MCSGLETEHQYAFFLWTSIPLSVLPLSFGTRYFSDRHATPVVLLSWTFRLLSALVPPFLIAVLWRHPAVALVDFYLTLGFTSSSIELGAGFLSVRVVPDVSLVVGCFLGSALLAMFQYLLQLFHVVHQPDTVAPTPSASLNFSLLGVMAHLRCAVLVCLGGVFNYSRLTRPFWLVCSQARN